VRARGFRVSEGLELFCIKVCDLLGSVGQYLSRFGYVLGL
jgi:hypothetical protein